MNFSQLAHACFHFAVVSYYLSTSLMVSRLHSSLRQVDPLGKNSILLVSKCIPIVLLDV